MTKESTLEAGERIEPEDFQMEPEASQVLAALLEYDERAVDPTKALGPESTPLRKQIAAAMLFELERVRQRLAGVEEILERVPFCDFDWEDDEHSSVDRVAGLDAVGEIGRILDGLRVAMVGYLRWFNRSRVVELDGETLEAAKRLGAGFIHHGRVRTVIDYAIRELAGQPDAHERVLQSHLGDDWRRIVECHNMIGERTDDDSPGEDSADGKPTKEELARQLKAAFDSDADEGDDEPADDEVVEGGNDRRSAMRHLGELVGRRRAELGDDGPGDEQAADGQGDGDEADARYGVPVFLQLANRSVIADGETEVLTDLTVALADLPALRRDVRVLASNYQRRYTDVLADAADRAEAVSA